MTVTYRVYRQKPGETSIKTDIGELEIPQVEWDSDEKERFTIVVRNHQNGDFDILENIRADKLEGTFVQVKRDFYYVEDFLRELVDLKFSYSYDHTEDVPSEFDPKKSSGYERIYYACEYQRNGKSVEFEYSIGYKRGASAEPPQRDDVLELIMGQIADVQAYSDVRNDMKQFEAWSEDCIVQSEKVDASTIWNKTWDNWEKVRQIIAPEEWERIRHAFYEGRRL